MEGSCQSALVTPLGFAEQHGIRVSLEVGGQHPHGAGGRGDFLQRGPKVVLERRAFLDRALDGGQGLLRLLQRRPERPGCVLDPLEGGPGVAQGLGDGGECSVFACCATWSTCLNVSATTGTTCPSMLCARACTAWSAWFILTATSLSMGVSSSIRRLVLLARVLKLCSAVLADASTVCTSGPFTSLETP